MLHHFICFKIDTKITDNFSMNTSEKTNHFNLTTTCCIRQIVDPHNGRIDPFDPRIMQPDDPSCWEFSISGPRRPQPWSFSCWHCSLDIVPWALRIQTEGHHEHVQLTLVIIILLGIVEKILCVVCGQAVYFVLNVTILRGYDKVIDEPSTSSWL